MTDTDRLWEVPGLLVFHSSENVRLEKEFECPVMEMKHNSDFDVMPIVYSTD